MEAGEGVMIGGFIISGNEPKRVIIRGIGPSMTSAGIADVVTDPILRLFGPNGAQIAWNDNWQDTQRTEIETTGIPPQDNLEAAMVATLAPGAYTATLASTNNGRGVGLVEIYDLSTGGSAKLANISTRGSVQTADNVMIGGFILGGSSTNPARVVVRAIGPSLAQAGIRNPLANPTLRLIDNNGQSIAFNDNWQDNPTQAAELQALNIAPTNPGESALIATLPLGSYTAVVAGQGGGTGIGLIEVYSIR